MSSGWNRHRPTERRVPRPVPIASRATRQGTENLPRRSGKMQSILKALACVLLPFVCIGLGFAQGRSGEPTPRVLTPQLVAHLPAEARS